MKKEVLDLWLTALRSGEYPQTVGALAKVGESVGSYDAPAGFCCLGVLCELAEKDFAVESSLDSVRIFKSYGELEEASILPHEVIEWAGIDENIYGPDINVKAENLVRPLSEEEYESCVVDGTISLAYLNDKIGYTFPEIATVLEREFANEARG